MERKEEPGHARRHGRDQKPFGPAIETLAGEQSKQDDKASEDSNKTDQRMNCCVNVQYHDLPITSISTRNVTSRSHDSQTDPFLLPKADVMEVEGIEARVLKKRGLP